jgi:hypothetical protein
LTLEDGRLVQPAELLKRARAANREGRLRLAEPIGQVVRKRGPGASQKVEPGQSELRARLLAYHEVLTYDGTGAVQGLAANVPEATLELSEIYSFLLRFDVARALLNIYAARWPKASYLSLALPIMGDADGPQDDFRDSRTHDVQIAPKREAAVTFVVFCGLRHAFGVQLNVLHHCCLARHNVNVVYLRDFEQALYLTGVKSLGGVAETCDALRDHFARLNAGKLVFVGNSGGVFAALHYGAMLGADLVLLFSGPTSLDIGMEHTERQAYHRLHDLHRAGQVDWPDLRDIYARRAPPVWLYYGSQNSFDRQQAENLAGLANVQLRPVATDFHFVIHRLAETGELERIFAAAAS